MVEAEDNTTTAARRVEVYLPPLRNPVSVGSPKTSKTPDPNQVYFRVISYFDCVNAWVKGMEPTGRRQVMVVSEKMLTTVDTMIKWTRLPDWPNEDDAELCSQPTLMYIT